MGEDQRPRFAVKTLKRPACWSVPLDVHYPTGVPGSAVYARQLERAKAVCGRCPLRAECLAYALDAGEAHGVWGGLDEYERRVLTGCGPIPCPVAS